jgi:hypothetical protein
MKFASHQTTTKGTKHAKLDGIRKEPNEAFPFNFKMMADAQVRSPWLCELFRVFCVFRGCL